MIVEARLVLALDGLDEVDQEKRPQVVSRLAEHVRRYPTVVTLRSAVLPAGAVLNESLGPLSELERFHLELSEWVAVEQELRRFGVPQEVLRGDAVQAFLRVPLHAQTLISAIHLRGLDPAEASQIAEDPTRLWHVYLARIRERAGKTPLRIAGVMSADHAKPLLGGTTTVRPVQLAGPAFTLAAWLGAGVVALLGWVSGERIAGLSFALTSLWSYSPWVNQHWVDRLATLFGRVDNNGWQRALQQMIATSAASFLTVHGSHVLLHSLFGEEPVRVALGYWNDGSLLFLVAYCVGISSFAYFEVPRLRRVARLPTRGSTSSPHFMRSPSSRSSSWS